MSSIKYILFAARSSVKILTTSQKVKVGKEFLGEEIREKTRRPLLGNAA